MTKRLFTTVHVLWLGTFGVLSPVSGAPFANLGFDDANTNNPVQINGDHSFLGTPKDLLPGWRVSGESLSSLIGVNERAAGFGVVSLYTPDSPWPPAEGRFSLALVPFSGSSYSLTQAGEIPEGARAMHFLSFNLHVS